MVGTTRRGKKSKSVEAPPAADTPHENFPIVGLGASAGGLEAFEQFFRSMPPDNGMAFVLVPHLDPSHASILTEILQRSTAMPVIEAQDQVAVAPNGVYVIPPNRNMAIFHGALQLSVPDVPRGQRMPIDAFLRSLAEDQGDNAIAIILSGTGTDGTLGLRAILGAGGITLVQEPATAKYDGMPASAIQAGYATHVLPVEEMPPVLLAAARQLPVRTEPPATTASTATPAAAVGGLNRILMLLRSAAVNHAASTGTPTLGHILPVKTNGDFQRISFSVRPLPEPDAGEGLLLVSFQDLAGALTEKAGAGKTAPAKSARGKMGEARRIEELERDLAYTKENLQATIEEQQASNEELKSTNEEMQSTNEELQSTNEELETSKEELQSLNEELVTVNAELQAKIEQLAGMQNDMKNLLDNINTGTVFLDEHLLIRRFTREAARVYRLVASDVGRPLADIKSDLQGEDLLAEARAVLDTLAPCEREVRTTGGDWYLARIQPYRTLENVIEGVVLTFTDISQRVAAEAAVREARKLAEGIVDTVREPLIVLDGDLRVVSASRSFYRNFRVAPENTVGRQIYELGNRQWDIPALRELLENILPHDRSFDGYEVEHDFPAIGRRRMLLNARRIAGGTDGRDLILLAMEAAEL